MANVLNPKIRIELNEKISISDNDNRKAPSRKKSNLTKP